MNVLLYGNCQIRAIGRVANILNNPLYVVNQIECMTDISKDKFLDAVRSADLIITTFITDTYKNVDYLSTKFILENAKKESKIYTIPSIYFDYYYVDLTYLRDNAIHNYSPAYHHKYLIDIFRNKQSIDHYIKNYVENEGLMTIEQLEERANISLNRLRDNEKRMQMHTNIRPYKIIGVSEFIQTNYKQKLLFYSMNHPTKYIFQYVAEIILTDLNISPKNINYDLCPLNWIKCIIYSCVQKGVWFDISKCSPLVGGKTDVRAICRLYYEMYRKIGSTDLSY
jgi:hypothetical protein